MAWLAVDFLFLIFDFVLLAFSGSLLGNYGEWEEFSMPVKW